MWSLLTSMVVHYFVYSKQGGKIIDGESQVFFDNII